LPVVIHTTLDASVSGSSVVTGIAHATLSILDSGNSIAFASADCNAYQGCTSAHYGDPINLLLAPNHEYTVSLGVYASANYDNTANTTADPQITLDPTFAHASDYTLSLSDGIGNSLSSVPEPSSFPLMATAALLVAGRRRARPGRTHISR
jgi:hypothetical protein